MIVLVSLIVMLRELLVPMIFHILLFILLNDFCPCSTHFFNAYTCMRNAPWINLAAHAPVIQY